MKDLFQYDSKIGKINIAEENGKVTDLFFETDFKYSIMIVTLEATPLIKETIRQLDEYLEGKRKEFDLPFGFEGTEFQKKVWAELLKIPYGETRSYGEIAENIGVAKGARAVGFANNRNPISIIVPCHRVIGADGKLVGYGGGLPIKKMLLDLEGSKYFGK